MSTNKTLIVHIGSEKTGSKSIQRSLSRSCHDALRRRGVLYPKQSSLFLRNAHYPIVSPFLDPADLDFVEIGNRLTRDSLHAGLALLRQHTDVDTIVLSAEHLSSRLQQRQIEELGAILRAALPDHRIRILYHVRSQSTQYCAGTSTYLKTFGIAYKLPADVEKSERFFNHFNVACEWASVFGKDNITINNYHDSDALSLFYASLGFDDKALPIRRPLKQNISLSREEAAVLLAVNTAFGKADFAHESLIRVRRRVQRMLIMHLRTVLPVRTPFTSVLRAADWLHFRREFAESNDRLQEAFGLDFNLNDHMSEGELAAAAAAKDDPTAYEAVRKELARWQRVIGEPPRTPGEAEATARRLHAALVSRLLRHYVLGFGAPWRANRRIMRD